MRRVSLQSIEAERARRLPSIKVTDIISFLGSLIKHLPSKLLGFKADDSVSTSLFIFWKNMTEPKFMLIHLMPEYFKHRNWNIKFKVTHMYKSNVVLKNEVSVAEGVKIL